MAQFDNKTLKNILQNNLKFDRMGNAYSEAPPENYVLANPEEQPIDISDELVAAGISKPQELLPKILNKPIIKSKSDDIIPQTKLDKIQPEEESFSNKFSNLINSMSGIKPSTITGTDDESLAMREYEDAINDKKRKDFINNMFGGLKKISAGYGGLGGAGAVLKVDETPKSDDSYISAAKDKLSAIINKNKARREEDQKVAKDKYDKFQDDRWFKLKSDASNENLKDEQNKDIDRQVIQLKNKLDASEIPGMITTVNNIDAKMKELGGSLNNIPDVDLPGIGPLDKHKFDFMLGKDISLKQDIAKLANSLRHENFGSSQTAQEMKNFVEEASTGNFSDEKQTMMFVQKLSEYVKNKAKNLEAVNPKVKEKYREYTGTNLPSEQIQFNSQKNTPKFQLSEKNINTFMQKNKVSKEEAIKILSGGEK